MSAPREQICPINRAVKQGQSRGRFISTQSHKRQIFNDGKHVACKGKALRMRFEAVPYLYSVLIYFRTIESSGALLVQACLFLPQQKTFNTITGEFYLG